MEELKVVRIRKENDILEVDFSKVKKDIILKVIKLTTIPEGDLVHPEINLRVLREVLELSFKSGKEVCLIV